MRLKRPIKSANWSSVHRKIFLLTNGKMLLKLFFVLNTFESFRYLKADKFFYLDIYHRTLMSYERCNCEKEKKNNNNDEQVKNTCNALFLKFISVSDELGTFPHHDCVFKCLNCFIKMLSLVQKLSVPCFVS